MASCTPSAHTHAHTRTHTHTHARVCVRDVNGNVMVTWCVHRHSTRLSPLSHLLSTDALRAAHPSAALNNAAPCEAITRRSSRTSTCFFASSSCACACACLGMPLPSDARGGGGRSRGLRARLDPGSTARLPPTPLTQVVGRGRARVPGRRKAISCAFIGSRRSLVLAGAARAARCFLLLAFRRATAAELLRLGHAAPELVRSLRAMPHAAAASAATTSALARGTAPPPPRRLPSRH